MPADSFTGNLNLRKPEVGAAFDTWGGAAGLNSDLDILDAIFLATGLSTVAPPPGNPLAGVPGVGLRIGKGMVLNVEGELLLKDSTDTTKIVAFDESLISTGTTRTFQFPDENGVLATQVDVAIRCPTGTVLSGYFGAAPPGFVMADGRTIGDATSGATNRANADTVGLFTQFWNLGFTPSGGRGASAAADFAAHKTMALPNHSGRTMAGRDNLSGAAAGILSGFTSVGVVGGVQSMSATVSATGNASVSGTTGAVTAGQSTLVAAGTNAGPVGLDFHSHSMSFNAPVSVSGGTTAFSIIQPTIAVDVIIAL